MKLAVGNEPSDSKSLFAGWLELTEELLPETKAELQAEVLKLRAQLQQLSP